MKRALMSPQAWLLSLLAGARKPAPSTSVGSRRPDPRTGRARRLSLLAVLALLAGALSLFAPATTEARTVVWKATLEPKPFLADHHGCGPQAFAGAARCQLSSNLNPNTFTFNGKQWRVSRVHYQKTSGIVNGVAARVVNFTVAFAGTATLADAVAFQKLKLTIGDVTFTLGRGNNAAYRLEEQANFVSGGSTVDSLVYIRNGAEQHMQTLADALEAGNAIEIELSEPAAAPVEAQRAIWSSTLTVDHNSISSNTWDGCHSDDSDLADCSAAMSDDDFVAPDVGTYEIRTALITYVSGIRRLTFRTRPASGANGLPTSFDELAFLTVDGSSSFRFADADRTTASGGVVTYKWNSPGFRWNDNQQVSLKLSVLAPAPPLNLRVNPGTGQLGLSWTAPPGAPGYDVHYTSVMNPNLVSDTQPALNHPLRNSPKAGWVAFPRTGTTASQTISGLTSGTDYRVRVRARNIAGVSDWVFGTGRTSGTAPLPAGVFAPEPGSQILLSATFRTGAYSFVVGCSTGDAAGPDCSFPPFTLEGTTYRIDSLTTLATHSPNELTFTVDPDMSPSDFGRLTLHIDGNPFSVADINATVGNSSVRWPNPRVRWAKDQWVQVHLTYKPPTVSLSASPNPVQEGSPVTVTATLSEALSEDVRIRLNSAAAGLFHIDIPAGQTTGTHEFTAPQLEDGEMKQYQIAVDWSLMPKSTPLSPKGSQSIAGVTVLDENADPHRVSVSDASGTEMENGYPRLCFAFTLDRAASHEIWVGYRTEDGTATAGQDYQGVVGSPVIPFEPGETRKRKCFNILDDNVEDSGETFSVVLVNPHGAILGRDRGTGTIYNHEPTSLSALTAEGAPGEDGPFTALDIGTFAPATTAYAATVPHGTTHARLTPKSLNRHLTITTGLDGKKKSQVPFGGGTGPAVALAVGENVLVVKTQLYTGQRQTYRVTITREASQAPTVASAISDATITNESGTSRVSLSGVFTDADGDDLTVTASSSSESVATVSVSADYSSLTLTAKARGTATITVTADDGTATVEDSFTVTVKAAPTVASAIADISELAAGASQEISLSGVFSDADGDALTLSAVSSSNAVVTVVAQLDPVTASATAITVTGVDEGTATVTVTARDTNGNSVSDAFDVTVPVVEEQQSVELPGPVVSLAVTASAEDSVTVSWSAPETGGAPQGYIVHIKRKGGGYQDTLRPGADRTQVSFSSLDSGRTYDVWVRAQNGTGKGERVSASITLPESEDTPPAVLPGPVTGLELMADGNALTVSWSAPETGGAPDGYIVHVSPDDGGKGKTKTPKAMKTRVTFKNMEAGRTYGVWVRAQNEAGKGNRVHASITLPEKENRPKPQPTATPTPTATPVPTATATPTATPVPTATSTPVPTATSTPVPTATSTPVPTATATATPIPTATAAAAPVPTATSTPAPTATATPASQSSDIVAQYDSNGNGVIDGAECDRVIADYQAWIINTQELLELRKVWACN